MRDILTIHFGPENGTPIDAVPVSHSRPPVDHVCSWYQRTLYGFTFWECGWCYATTTEPPPDSPQ